MTVMVAAFLVDIFRKVPIKSSHTTGVLACMLPPIPSMTIRDRLAPGCHGATIALLTNQISHPAAGLLRRVSGLHLDSGVAA